MLSSNSTPMGTNNKDLHDIDYSPVCRCDVQNRKISQLQNCIQEQIVNADKLRAVPVLQVANEAAHLEKLIKQFLGQLKCA